MNVARWWHAATKDTYSTMDRCVRVYVFPFDTGPRSMSDLGGWITSVATVTMTLTAAVVPVKYTSAHNLELLARHMTYARAIDAHGACRRRLGAASRGHPCPFEALRIEAGGQAPHEVLGLVLRGMVSYAFTAY